jgi:hypothetical protein
LHQVLLISITRILFDILIIAFWLCHLVEESQSVHGMSVASGAEFQGVQSGNLNVSAVQQAALDQVHHWHHYLTPAA